MREIIVVPFDFAKYWGTIQLWWSERKFNPPPRDFFPYTGYIVKINGVPVCAGFLTMTDANVAVAGHFVSDPRLPGEYRNEALDLLIDTLVKKSKMIGIKGLFVSTTIDSLKKRFERHGFKLTDEKVDVFGLMA